LAARGLVEVSISYTDAEKQAMQDQLNVIEAQLANQ
jgi:hypothetical protein